MQIVKIYLHGKKGAGKFAIVDEIDSRKVSEIKWYLDSNGYAMNRFGRRMHRLILPNTQEVDHKNRNGLDNTRNNLRSATRSINNRNRGSQKNNKSGVKGVSFCNTKKLWRAQIMVNKKYISLGYFDSLKAATESRKLGELTYANC